MVDEIIHNEEFELEIFNKKSTSPNLEEHEMVCPRVKFEEVLEYSFHYLLEIIPLTYECPHPPSLPLTCSPSSPSIQSDIETQLIMCISLLDPPSQHVLFSDFTSKFKYLQYNDTIKEFI